MAARQHHYLSQCYLKGFTSNGSKKSKLVVFDFKEKKMFETTPRNVGGVRDFNRIDHPDVEPDALENALAQYETHVASAIRRVIEGGAFDGDDKAYILNLISLIAVRSPEMRENLRRFQAEIVEMMMTQVLATRERWEAVCQDAERDGIDLGGGRDYEGMRDFVTGKQYKIEFAREHQMGLEFHGVEAVLPLLFDRNWTLVRTSDSSGFFLTTDKPVCLTWNHPEQLPEFFRHSPGFGMRDTMLYFPLSKDTAIIGEFDGREGEITASRRLVTMLNTHALSNFYKQVYAPKLGFNFYLKNGDVADGKHMLRNLG